MQKTAASLAAAGKHALFDEGAATANPHPFLAVSALSVRLDVRSLRSQPGCYPHADSNRSEEHTSELQSRLHLVCRLLLEKKKKNTYTQTDSRSRSITRHLAHHG